MKRTVAIVIAVVILVAFVSAAHWLNPGEVDFRLTHIHSFRPTLGLLIVLALVAGVVIAVLGVATQQWARRMRGWRGRRQTRIAERVEEWNQSGAALAWGGEVERSRSVLKKAWRRERGNRQAALSLAASYSDTGEYAAAKQILEEAVADNANDPNLRYALGKALRRNGENADAIRMLETVRVQHPRAPRVLISLRDLYHAEGRWQDAARVQETYLQTLSNSASSAAERRRLLHFRYQAAVSKEDVDARPAALAAIVQEDRSFVPSLVSLGDALVESGRAEEARRLWEKAFKQQPRLVFIERLLAQLSDPRERRRIVTLMGKSRQQLDPDSVHLLTARAALDDNDTQTAAAELATVGRSDAASVQRCWADLYQQQGRQQESWGALRRVADDAGTEATGYHCTSCGRVNATWTGYCPRCERWDTYRSGTELNT